MGDPKTSLDAPRKLRESAASACMTAVGADAFGSYMVVRGTDDVVRYHGVAAVAVRPEVDALWSDGTGAVRVNGDVEVDEIAPNNRFGHPPESLYGKMAWRGFFGQFGYQRMLYMSVTAGTAQRGVACFLRSTPGEFEVAPEVLRRVSAEVAGAYRDAWALEEALAPPEGTLVVSPAKDVEGSPESLAWVERTGARAWLDVLCTRAGPQRTMLGISPYQWAPASLARVTPLPDGRAAVTFEGVRAVEMPAVVMELTPLQRRVAVMMASGATVAEIARGLDRSTETVREHIEAIYARLGVASRAEVATLCATFTR